MRRLGCRRITDGEKRDGKQLRCRDSVIHMLAPPRTAQVRAPYSSFLILCCGGGERRRRVRRCIALVVVLALIYSRTDIVVSSPSHWQSFLLYLHQGRGSARRRRTTCNPRGVCAENQTQERTRFTASDLMHRRTTIVMHGKTKIVRILKTRTR